MLGNVQGNGRPEIVVGVPSSSILDDPGTWSCSRSRVRAASTSGVATSRGQRDLGVPGGLEDGDRFGEAVTLVDRDADGRPESTVAAPGEDDEGGRVTTLPGTGSGLTTAGADAYGLRDLRYADRFQARSGTALGQ